MKSPPLKIAIFGAGLVGSYLGGQLAHSGLPVCFIGRAGSKESFEKNGLKLTHYARDAIIIPSKGAEFSTDPKRLKAADVIFLTVKSQDTEEAARIIKAHANPNALLISFQNGVRNADILKTVLGPMSSLRAVIPFNVTQMTSGALHCGTEGKLTIEQSDDQRLAPLIDAFAQARQGTVLSPHIENVQWGKLLVNLNNGLNTLTGGTLRAGLMERDYRRTLILQLREALELTHKAGIKPAAFGKVSPQKMIKILGLPNCLYAIIMNRVIKIDAKARSSMLDDLERGRAGEIDYLQGEITRLAHSLNLAAPYNQKIKELVETAFAAGGSPKMSGTEILQVISNEGREPL